MMKKDTQDQVLLEQMQQGDKQALRVLFDRYYPYIISVVVANTGNRELAKDVGQEVFLELWRKREKLNVQGALKPYLRRAGINRMLNRIKSERLSYMETEEIPDTSRPVHTPQEFLEANDLQKIVQATIDRMPEKCRLIFQLCRMEGLSHKEIAQQLNISTKTIENQMTKALKMLKASLAAYDSRGLSILILWIMTITVSSLLTFSILA